MALSAPRLCGLSALLLAGAALLGACSSGEGSANSPFTGGGGADCGSLCSKILAAHCPNDNASDCNSQCAKAIGEYPGCSAQMSAVLGCTVNKLPLVCGSNGKATYSGSNGSQTLQTACPNEYKQLVSCAACIASPNDDASTACLKSKCCSQMQASVSDTNLSAYEDCLSSCSDTTCMDACKKQYPSVGSALDAVTACGLAAKC